MFTSGLSVAVVVVVVGVIIRRDWRDRVVVSCLGLDVGEASKSATDDGAIAVYTGVGAVFATVFTVVAVFTVVTRPAVPTILRPAVLAAEQKLTN